MWERHLTKWDFWSTLRIRMKKKTHPKKQIHKIAHKETTKPVISSSSLIIISGFISVLAVVFVIANKGTVMHSVQGTAIIRGMFNEATISLPHIPNAVAYNIYYGEKQPFTHAVRKIPPTVTTYTIQYLKKNVSYSYQISAINTQGREFWFSPVTSVTDTQGM